MLVSDSQTHCVAIANVRARVAFPTSPSLRRMSMVIPDLPPPLASLPSPRIFFVFREEIITVNVTWLTRFFFTFVSLQVYQC